MYKASFPLILGAIFSILLLGIINAHGQKILGINVWTDRITYTPADETVGISGCVVSPESSLAGKQVTIEIEDPNGETVKSENATINDTCNFNYLFNLKEEMMTHGNYVVQVSYGDKTGTTAFIISDENNSKADGECQKTYCNYYFRLYSNIYPIKYKLSDGKLATMFADIQAKALMVVTNSTSDGTLTLVLPRDFIDSKDDVIDGGLDRPYVVYIGNFTENFGMEVARFQEVVIGEDDRILVVNYPAGTKQIEIAGTYFVPEFNSLLMIVTALSISGMVILSKWNAGRTKVGI